MFDFAGLANQWFAVCRSDRLRSTPVPCSVLGQPLALFRDGERLAGAVLDRCPHRNAPLSRGRVCAGRLVCPYHGWAFDRSGQCQEIPGSADEAVAHKRTVRSFPVAEQDGLVWVNPGPQASAMDVPPRIELLQQAGYISFVRDFRLEASLIDAVENFLDPTHTHFVHSGLVRVENIRRPVRAVVRRSGDFAEAEYHEEAQTGWIARLFGGGITRTVGRFVLPSTVQLEYWAGDTLKLLITQYFTPTTPTEQQVFAVVVANPTPFPRWLVQRPFEWMLARVVRQDQHILAQQSANLRRFGGSSYTSTDLDLLRPHIVRLLEKGRTTGETVTEKQVVLML